MPNGNDKNWVRLCCAIDGFRSRYGVWPTTVRAHPFIVRNIRRELLTKQDLRKLNDKTKLIKGPMRMPGDGIAGPIVYLIAEDGKGRTFTYGSRRGKVRGIWARDWLGIEPHVEPEDSYHVFTPPPEKQGEADHQATGELDTARKPALKLLPFDYALLKGRQKENFNFQKLSAVLADFGFATMRLSDDWLGADFIAMHVDGQTFIRVQLKGRAHFREIYERKDLYVAFFEKPYWYLYPHEELLSILRHKKPKMFDTKSWKLRGGYSFRRLDPVLLEVFLPYRIPKAIAASEEPVDIEEPD
jgi:hypothetical protein